MGIEREPELEPVSDVGYDSWFDGILIAYGTINYR